MSEAQQDELENVIWCADGATLDVERKHNLDKRSDCQGQRVMSSPYDILHLRVNRAGKAFLI